MIASKQLRQCICRDLHKLVLDSKSSKDELDMLDIRLLLCMKHLVQQGVPARHANWLMHAKTIGMDWNAAT